MSACNSIDRELAALKRRQRKLARLLELRSEVELMEDKLGARDLPIVTVQRVVAAKMSISIFEMTIKDRCERIAWPRQIAMFLARKLTGLSLKQIGEAFGGRDHGTVHHACMLVSSRLSIDRNGGLSRLLTELEAACNNVEQPVNNVPVSNGKVREQNAN